MRYLVLIFCLLFPAFSFAQTKPVTPLQNIKKKVDKWQEIIPIKVKQKYVLKFKRGDKKWAVVQWTTDYLNAKADDPQPQWRFFAYSNKDQATLLFPGLNFGEKARGRLPVNFRVKYTNQGPRLTLKK